MKTTSMSKLLKRLYPESNVRKLKHCYHPLLEILPGVRNDWTDTDRREYALGLGLTLQEWRTGEDAVPQTAEYNYVLGEWGLDPSEDAFWEATENLSANEECRNNDNK